MELQEVYTSLTEEITSIDRLLDSLTDSASAGKTAKINEFVAATEDGWGEVVADFVSQLSAADNEVMIGIYFGITRGLNKAFSTKVNEVLDELVKNQPKAVPLINPEEAPALGKARSELYAKVKAVIQLAESFGEEWEMSMPSKRTGTKGPRGKRAISFFTWFVEDKEFQKLAQVVDLYDQYSKVSDLTAAMREAKINLTEPEDRIEFTLPDGKLLIGLNGNVDTSFDEDSDEDEAASEEE